MKLKIIVRSFSYANVLFAVSVSLSKRKDGMNFRSYIPQ